MSVFFLQNHMVVAMRPSKFKGLREKTNCESLLLIPEKVLGKFL